MVPFFQEKKKTRRCVESLCKERKCQETSVSTPGRLNEEGKLVRRFPGRQMDEDCLRVRIDGTTTSAEQFSYPRRWRTVAYPMPSTCDHKGGDGGRRFWEEDREIGVTLRGRSLGGKAS